jgi:hypothetical protein
LIDTEITRSGIRIRSGGRAATFFTDGGEYTFSKENLLIAGMLDVKGIGTHKLADI